MAKQNIPVPPCHRPRRSEGFCWDDAADAIYLRGVHKEGYVRGAREGVSAEIESSVAEKGEKGFGFESRGEHFLVEWVMGRSLVRVSGCRFLCETFRLSDRHSLGATKKLRHQVSSTRCKQVDFTR